MIPKLSPGPSTTVSIVYPLMLREQTQPARSSLSSSLLDVTVEIVSNDIHVPNNPCTGSCTYPSADGCNPQTAVHDIAECLMNTGLVKPHMSNYQPELMDNFFPVYLHPTRIHGIHRLIPTIPIPNRQMHRLSAQAHRHHCRGTSRLNPHAKTSA
jgi:hypothetical protein